MLTKPAAQFKRFRLKLPGRYLNYFKIILRYGVDGQRNGPLKCIH